MSLALEHGPKKRPCLIPQAKYFVTEEDMSVTNRRKLLRNILTVTSFSYFQEEP